MGVLHFMCYPFVLQGESCSKLPRSRIVPSFQIVFRKSHRKRFTKPSIYRIGPLSSVSISV